MKILVSMFEGPISLIIKKKQILPPNETPLANKFFGKENGNFAPLYEMKYFHDCDENTEILVLTMEH